MRLSLRNLGLMFACLSGASCIRGGSSAVFRCVFCLFPLHLFGKRRSTFSFFRQRGKETGQNSGAAEQALGARMRMDLLTVGATQSIVTGSPIRPGFTELPMKKRGCGTAALRTT